MGHGKLYGTGESEGGRCEGRGGTRKTHGNPKYIGPAANVVQTREGGRIVLRVPVPGSKSPKKQERYEPENLSYQLPQGQDITACFEGKGKRI
ncbi:MAG: hypothetical protein AABW80_03930 [Nanoarchaeota archaeon]